MKILIFLIFCSSIQPLLSFDDLFEYKLELLKKHPPPKQAKFIKVDKTFSIKQSSSDSFLKNTTCLEVHKKNFYVLDNNLHKLVMFGRGGDFVKKIGQEGVGPGDLYYPAWFDIFQDKIYIRNNNGIDIFTSSGVYKDRIRFFLAFRTFSIVDNFIYTASKGKYRDRYPFMMKFDMKGKIKEAYYDKEFDEGVIKYNNRANIVSSNDKIVFISNQSAKFYVCGNTNKSIKANRIKYKLLDEIEKWNHKKDIKQTKQFSWLSNMIASAKSSSEKIYVLLRIPRLEIISIDLEGNVQQHFYNDKDFKFMRWLDLTIEENEGKLIFYVMGFSIGDEVEKDKQEIGVYRLETTRQDK